jgi:hypothetical protein
MPSLNIILDGDGCWPDLVGDKSPEKVFDQHVSLAVARLPGGMCSGADSVAIRADMKDGRVLVFQTSMALFLAAADAFRARQQAEEQASHPKH